MRRIERSIKALEARIARLRIGASQTPHGDGRPGGENNNRS
jgi:hypothetical protein